MRRNIAFHETPHLSPPETIVKTVFRQAFPTVSDSKLILSKNRCVLIRLYEFRPLLHKWYNPHKFNLIRVVAHLVVYKQKYTRGVSTEHVKKLWTETNFNLDMQADHSFGGSALLT